MQDADTTIRSASPSTYFRDVSKPIFLVSL